MRAHTSINIANKKIKQLLVPLWSSWCLLTLLLTIENDENERMMMMRMMQMKE